MTDQPREARTGRWLRRLGFALGGGVLLLGITWLAAGPRFVPLGNGHTLIQFLNLEGPSYLVRHRYTDSEDATVTVLSEDEGAIVEVRDGKGSSKAKAHLSPKPDSGAPFPATREEMDRAGILLWNIPIPEDLEEGEYLATEWRIDDEVHDSGLSFEDVPAGQTATVILWTGEYTEYYANSFEGDPPPGMPFSVSFPGSRKFPTTRHGRLRVPEGWEEPYGHLATGDYADGGWIMLRCNRKHGKTHDYFAFLEVVYRFQDDGESENAEE